MPKKASLKTATAYLASEVHAAERVVIAAAADNVEHSATVTVAMHDAVALLRSAQQRLLRATTV